MAALATGQGTISVEGETLVLHNMTDLVGALPHGNSAYSDNPFRMVTAAAVVCLGGEKTWSRYSSLSTTIGSTMAARLAGT